MRFPTYSSALAWLYARNQFAMKMGLEKTRELLAAVGNPERDGAFLHVAGTNGKGSVCTALAAMLPVLGVKRVGLYTSPHLVSFRERIRVDGAPVTAAFVTGWLNAHADALERLNPTYFEIVTAMAFAWFRERGCEAVVLETGLGGRLDATNVVAPRVTVITAISLDHTEILGGTHEAILGEKLGIVKPGVPLVIDEARPALARLAAETAHTRGAPFLNMADRFAPAREGARVLRGRFADIAVPADLRHEEYQMRNAALALLALEAWHGAALPAAAAWLPALRDARMPGRMQRLVPRPSEQNHSRGAGRAPSIPVLLDGAHNPAAAEALSDHLRARPLGARTRIFFAAMRDKDVAAVYASLRALSNDLVFVDLSADNPRALGGAELRARLGLQASEGGEGLRIIFPTPEALLPLLDADSGADGAVFCGSLYLLGAVIPLLAERYEGLDEFAALKREDG